MQTLGLAASLIVLTASIIEAAPLRRSSDDAIGGGITPISLINQNDAQGFSPLEFVMVTIEGVVQIDSGFLDPFDDATTSSWFYVSDGTGGIAVARRLEVTPAHTGDRVQVAAIVVTQGVSPVSGTRTLDLGLGVGSVTVVGGEVWILRS